jgi:hypothetical protein
MLNTVKPDAPETETPDIHRNSGPFSNKIYDPNFDIVVSMFTQPHGVVYICQGHMKQQTFMNSNSASCSESVTRKIDVNIKYSVTMLHHGRKQM